MNRLAHEKKVAILLNALGKDAVDPALQLLDPKVSKAIRSELKNIENSPPRVTVVEEVLDDFERFFKFAVEAAGVDTYWSKLAETENANSLKFPGPTREPREAAMGGTDSGSDLENESIQSAVGKSKFGQGNDLDDDDEVVDNSPSFRVFTPSDDEKHDLRRLHPVQIAEALKNERVKTMALVLDCLDQKRKAAVIELLPREIHGELLSLLLSDINVPEELLSRIIRTVVTNALTVDKPKDEAPDPFEAIAGVLRELPRETRNNMMNHLREKSEDDALKVQRLLYLFEDVVNYDDKSIQKILAEVDKGQLVISLQPASDEIKDRILDNLSKRAKESLIEELELLGKQADALVKEAQSSVAEVIANLDQADQLEFI